MPPRSRSSRRSHALRRAVLGVAAPLLVLQAAALAASTELRVAPGIAFAWTDPITEGLLVFQLASLPATTDPITEVATPGARLTVAGYRLAPEDGSLTLSVRASQAGVVDVPALLVATRYGPRRRVRVGAAEVVALPEVGGALVLRRWSADNELGLYAAFALENAGPVPVTVRTLRYAPEPLGRGLLLVDHGPPQRFETWRDAVLTRMAPAFAAYLLRRGRSPTVPDRALEPTSLAFPLAGALAGAHWRAPSAVDVRLEPGEAIFAAVTPAAFSTYVDDLVIVAYPVVGYATVAADGTDDAGCCRLQGVAAPILNRGRGPGSPPP